MLREDPVPLADDSVGCALETDPRSVQNGSNSYSVTLNRDWLAQLCLQEQGAATVHSLALRPVEIRQPAIIIQPAAEVLRHE